MTADPENLFKVRQLLLRLRDSEAALPDDLLVEGPLYARKATAAGNGGAPLKASHPRTIIYRGRSASLPHPLAIKVIDTGSALKLPDWIEREAAVLARLQAVASRQGNQSLAGHLYAFDAGKGVLVSEWIPGRNLRTWLTTYGHLPGMRQRGLSAAGQWLAGFNRAMGATRGSASYSLDYVSTRDVYEESGAVAQGIPNMLACLEVAASRLQDAPCLMATSHGDFSPNNMLMPGNSTMLRAIDFTLPELAPVAQDAAHFLVNRSIRLAADIRQPGAAWQSWAAFRSFTEGYGQEADSAFPPQLMSFYALAFCIRRIAGLSLTLTQANRAWYDRLDRRRELYRHMRLARVFADHLAKTLSYRK